MARPRVVCRSGFTLLEVVIGALLMALLLGAIGMTVLRGGVAYEAGIAVSATEVKARRVLDRVANEFAAAGVGSLDPPPAGPLGVSSVEFRTCTGVAGGAATWSNDKRIAFAYDPGEVDDGLDNDGDGLADEGQLVLTLDAGLATEQSVVLTGYVRELLEGELPNGNDDNGNGLLDEGGVSFELVGQTLMIRLTLERRDTDNNLLTRTVETGIRLRN
jgi:hypothetical protein